MKKAKVMVCVVSAAMALLAGLGLAVAEFVAPETTEPHWFLKRHSLSVGLAVFAAVGAAFVPWRAWLKASPWLFVVYLAVFFGSAMCPMVNGWHRFLFVGNLPLIDTWVWGWPVAAIFLAFIRSKISLPSWQLLTAVVIAGMVCFTGGVLSNANRVERLRTFFTEKAESLTVPSEAVERNERAKAVKAAYLNSAWIGESAKKSVEDVPLAHTGAVSAGIAVRFGRLVHWAMLSLFGAVGVILLLVGRCLADSPKRVFLFVFGLGLVGLAFLNGAEVLHLVPMFGVCVPLVSFGMQQCIVAGLNLGIVWSMVREDDYGNS